jgi:hypothetical protein
VSLVKEWHSFYILRKVKMKKLIIIILLALFVSGCSFHSNYNPGKIEYRETDRPVGAR